MAEEPKASSAFDVSDVEITSAETPKSKRKRSEARLEVVKTGKPETAGARLPGVHERKSRKRAAKAPISSEGKLNASAAGEIATGEDLPQAAPEKSEVEEALQMVRETAEESAWDAKIDEAKGKIAAEEAEWEAKISETKAKIRGEELRAKLPKIPAYKDKRVAAPPVGAEVPEYEEMTVEGAPKAFTEKEEAWFKQGEDEKHVAAQAAKQHEEEGHKIEDVRRRIAETYDDTKRETVLDSDEDVDAVAKQAEAMVASGRLNAEMFNAKDYRYLLLQQARIDKELETAGWWAARKLRSEMKEVRKELEGYESQIRHVISERAPSGALTAKEKEDIRYKGPAGKPALPQGSGTTVHKQGFFSRLFGRK